LWAWGGNIVRGVAVRMGEDESFNLKPFAHFIFALTIWLVVYYITSLLVSPDWHLVIGYTVGMINGIIVAKGWRQ
jgi:hypothetical protein